MKPALIKAAHRIFLGAFCFSTVMSTANAAEPHHQHHSPNVKPAPMQQNAKPSGEMQHSKMEIPAGKPVPAAALDVMPDGMGGWNLHVKVKNFRFAPETLGKTSTIEEGHAHLYINGKKVTRLYGPWYYLGKLPTGPHSITVTLNTNRHEDLFYQGNRIEATSRIIVFPAEVEQSHPQQSHPQQSHPQQSHPQQSHPQQSHPQQSHPH